MLWDDCWVLLQAPSIMPVMTAAIAIAVAFLMAFAPKDRIPVRPEI